MNKITSRVFVCQEPIHKKHGRSVRRIDLTPAEKYGKIVFVTHWSDTKDIGPSADALTWKIRRALRGFTEHDYIVPLGDPTVIKLVGIIAAEISGGRYRVLQWDNKSMRYDVIEVNIHCQPVEIT